RLRRPRLLGTWLLRARLLATPLTGLRGSEVLTGGRSGGASRCVHWLPASSCAAPLLPLAVLLLVGVAVVGRVDVVVLVVGDDLAVRTGVDGRGLAPAADRRLAPVVVDIRAAVDVGHRLVDVDGRRRAAAAAATPHGGACHGAHHEPRGVAPREADTVTARRQRRRPNTQQT